MCPLWGPHLGVLNSTGYLVLVVERRRRILNSEPSPITPGHPLCVSGLAMCLHVQTYGHILLHRNRKGGLLMKCVGGDTIRRRGTVKSTWGTSSEQTATHASAWPFLSFSSLQAPMGRSTSDIHFHPSVVRLVDRNLHLGGRNLSVTWVVVMCGRSHVTEDPLVN